MGESMVSEKEETLLLFFKPHQSIFFNLREREKHRSFASPTYTNRGLNPQPRYVP